MAKERARKSKKDYKYATTSIESPEEESQFSKYFWPALGGVGLLGGGAATIAALKHFGKWQATKDYINSLPGVGSVTKAVGDAGSAMGEGIGNMGSSIYNAVGKAMPDSIGGAANAVSAKAKALGQMIADKTGTDPIGAVGTGLKTGVGYLKDAAGSAKAGMDYVKAMFSDPDQNPEGFGAIANPSTPEELLTRQEHGGTVPRYSAGTLGKALASYAKDSNYGLKGDLPWAIAGGLGAGAGAVALSREGLLKKLLGGAALGLGGLSLGLHGGRAIAEIRKRYQRLKELQEANPDIEGLGAAQQEIPQAPPQDLAPEDIPLPPEESGEPMPPPPPPMPPGEMPPVAPPGTPGLAYGGMVPRYLWGKGGLHNLAKRGARYLGGDYPSLLGDTQSLMGTFSGLTGGGGGESSSGVQSAGTKPAGAVNAQAAQNAGQAQPMNFGPLDKLVNISGALTKPGVRELVGGVATGIGNTLTPNGNNGNNDFVDKGNTMSSLPSIMGNLGSAVGRIGSAALPIAGATALGFGAPLALGAGALGYIAGGRPLGNAIGGITSGIGKIPGAIWNAVRGNNEDSENSDDGYQINRGQRGEYTTPQVDFNSMFADASGGMVPRYDYGGNHDVRRQGGNLYKGLLGALGGGALGAFAGHHYANKRFLNQLADARYNSEDTTNLLANGSDWFGPTAGFGIPAALVGGLMGYNS